ncbi:hypothetical protein ACWGLG_11655 [Streptomyces antimycoticus]
MYRNTVLNRPRRIEQLCCSSPADHRFLLAGYLGLLTLDLLPSAKRTPADNGHSAPGP